MPDSEFEFVEELPPPSPTAGQGVSSVYARFRLELDERPGQWAIYPGRNKASVSSAQACVSTINTGKRKVFPSEFYEATSRETVVYVRRIP